MMKLYNPSKTMDPGLFATPFSIHTAITPFNDQLIVCERVLCNILSSTAVLLATRRRSSGLSLEVV